MKIQYNGDLSPMRIKVGGAFFNDWKKGEIKDMGEVEANILLKNKNFSKVIVKVQKTESRKSKAKEKIEEAEDKEE